MNEMAIFWLPIVGGLLLGGVAVGEWYGGNKVYALWFGFVGVICFLLVVVIQVQQALVGQPAVARTVTDIPSDERPLLVFESVAENSLEWRAGIRAFQWSFRFRNYGKHAAKVLSIKAFATIADSVPTIDGEPRGNTVYSPRPFVERFDIGSLPIVAPGAQTQEFVASGDHAPLKIDDQLPVNVREQRQRFYLLSVMPDSGPPTTGSQGIHFWLIGKIEYKDIFEGKTHTTQFGVYLTNPMHNLAEYPDPKYNYQD